MLSKISLSAWIANESCYSAATPAGFEIDSKIMYSIKMSSQIDTAKFSLKYSWKYSSRKQEVYIRIYWLIISNHLINTWLSVKNHWKQNPGLWSFLGLLLVTCLAWGSRSEPTSPHWWSQDCQAAGKHADQRKKLVVSPLFRHIFASAVSCQELKKINIPYLLAATKFISKNISFV